MHYEAIWNNHGSGKMLQVISCKMILLLKLSGTLPYSFLVEYLFTSSQGLQKRLPHLTRELQKMSEGLGAKHINIFGCFQRGLLERNHLFEKETTVKPSFCVWHTLEIDFQICNLGM
jgi:hypothetical protein